MAWNQFKQDVVVPNIKCVSNDPYDTYEKDTYIKDHLTGHVVHYKKMRGTFKDKMEMEWFPFDL